MAETKNVAKQALLSSNYWVINKIIVNKFGIEAAFLLSVFAEAENMMADPDGWFYQTIEKTEEITTLTRWKQEQAIKKLIAENLLEQVAKGMPRKRYYRINYEVLTNLFASDLQTGLRVAYKQECEPLTISKESSYKEDKKQDRLMPFDEVIDYFNKKTNSSYKSTTRRTKDLIKARVNDGFVLNDFYRVIDIKAEEWLNTEMNKYLRPETLFGTKFESYLNQKPATPDIRKTKMAKESFKNVSTNCRFIDVSARTWGDDYAGNTGAKK